MYTLKFSEKIKICIRTGMTIPIFLVEINNLCNQLITCSLDCY